MRVGTDTLISIRKLQHEDKEPIRQILLETDVFTNDEIVIAIELIDIFIDDAKQQDYDLYTAVNEQNEVAGYVCLGPTPLTIGTFDLYWIAVKPSFHGQGIGKQLLRYAETMAQSNNGRLLIAETSSQPKYEATRMFYIKNQYAEISRITDYYKPGDDLVVYGKYLSQSEGL
jgi:ribosomal protein S18 acetylase RimI-like enzyme